ATDSTPRRGSRAMDERSRIRRGLGAVAALAGYPPRSARRTHRASRRRLARHCRRGRGNDDPRRSDHGRAHRRIRPDRRVAARSRRAGRRRARDRRNDDRDRGPIGPCLRTTWRRAPRDRSRGLARFRHGRHVPRRADARFDRSRGAHRRARPWPRATDVTRDIGRLRLDALTLFGVFLKASALSLGGLSSLPLLRADLVAPGIATDDQVVQAIAIGRISTGPNGLYIVSLGYLVGGMVGATTALLAASLPPLVIVPITAVARRWLMTTSVAGLVRGVAMATAGLLVATGFGIMTATGTPALWQLALSAVCIVLTYRGTLHPAILIAIGAAAGLVFGR